MKKILSALLCMSVLLSLSACGQAAMPEDTDTAIPPRAPVSAIEGGVSARVEITDRSVLEPFIKDEAASFFYSVPTQLSLTLDPDDTGLKYVAVYSAGDVTTGITYNIATDGKGTYSLVERLPMYYDRNPVILKEEFDGTAQLISRFTDESSIGAALAMLGDASAGRVIDEDMLRLALAHSSDGEDSLDPTGRTRSISATFSCDELVGLMTELREKGKLTDGIAGLFHSFFSGERDAMLPERIRDAGDFSLSLRLSATKGGRVQLCDLTAKGADTHMSVVYDGATGDIDISARHKLTNGSERTASFLNKNEEGRRTVKLTTGTKPEDTRSIRLILSDGEVFFSSEGVNATGKYTSSVKYDANASVFTLTMADITVKLRAVDDGLVGELRDADTDKTSALHFERADDDHGAGYKLTKIAETDVSAAGVFFSFSKLK